MRHKGTDWLRARVSYVRTAHSDPQPQREMPRSTQDNTPPRTIFQKLDSPTTARAYTPGTYNFGFDEVYKQILEVIEILNFAG